MDVLFPGPSLLGQLYSSPKVLDPIDVLFLFEDTGGLLIDYFTVEASNSTKLRGQTILVDDTNPEIQWNGNWVLRENYFVELTNTSVFGDCLSDDGRTPMSVQPHGNATHESGSPGDSFTFRFSGKHKH